MQAPTGMRAFTIVWIGQVLSLLGTGILSFVPQGGKQVRLMVSGGYVEVDGDHVIVLCESAALAEEVSREETNKQLYEAEQKLKSLGPVGQEDENFQNLRAEVDRAAAKLTLIK